MDPQTQASFIPKKPLTAGASGYSRPTISIAWIISVVIFFGSLAAAGAAFAYQQYMASTLNSQKDSLARAQAAYDPAVITSILRWDDKLTQARSLLSDHIAPSGIFTYLEQRTLSNVRFTNFSYQNSSAGVQLALGGEALDFSSVALQSDAFDASSTPLRNVLFSNVNLNPSTGHIDFQVTATVDPGVISFEKNLTNTPPPTPATGTTTTH